MVQYTAGQRIRGSEINALPQMYRVASPQIATNNTLRDVVGLAFQGEALASYLVECFLAYHATEAGDIRFAWSVPSGTAQGDSPIYTGSWWAVAGIEPTIVGGTPGPFDAAVNTVLTTAHPRSGDNAVPMFAMPVAYIQLGATPGTVKLQFGQNNTVVHDTTIRVGSCMRVSRLP